MPVPRDTVTPDVIKPKYSMVGALGNVPNVKSVTNLSAKYGFATNCPVTVKPPEHVIELAVRFAVDMSAAESNDRVKYACPPATVSTFKGVVA